MNLLYLGFARSDFTSKSKQVKSPISPTFIASQQLTAPAATCSAPPPLTLRDAQTSRPFGGTRALTGGYRAAASHPTSGKNSPISPKTVRQSETKPTEIHTAKSCVLSPCLAQYIILQRQNNQRFLPRSTPFRHSAKSCRFTAKNSDKIMKKICIHFPNMAIISNEK